jgi:penicillin-binding protein 2
MAEVTSEIANGGYHVQPHIVRAIHKPNDTWLITHPEKTKIGWVNEKDIDLVKSAMRKVVTEGTARWYANIKTIKIAGKTGTAQNPHGNDHAWFISFAPYEHPRIAMAVLVENAGYGASSAVPISTLLIEKYLTGKVEQKQLFKRMVEFKPDKYDTTATEE